MGSPDIINSATPIENDLLGVHPRIYATESELDRVRSVLDTEPYSSLMARVTQQADLGLDAECPTGPLATEDRPCGDALASLTMAWKMTGDQKYFDSAIRILKDASLNDDWGVDLAFGHFAVGAAIAWDWLYDEIPESDRQEIAARLFERGEHCFREWAGYNDFAAFCYTWNHMAVPLCGLASLGGALYGECDGVAKWLKMTMEKARLMSDSLGPDGLVAEGTAYGQYHVMYLAQTLVLVDQLLGVDLIDDCGWWDEYGQAQLWHTFPREHWRNAQVFFMFGDADRAHWLGPDPQLRLAASRCDDGRAQWLADELHTSGSARSTVADLFNLLWQNQAVTPIPPSDLPRLKHFDDQDVVVMRSGWDGNESAMVLKCGPHSGYWNLRYNHNVSGGHMFPCAGGFALFANGDMLLCEPGYPHTKRTTYHNTLLVDGRGQLGEGGEWFEDLEFRKGHLTPSIIQATEGEQFDLVVGDATNAYPDDLGLEKFVRSVYFFRPDCWVVIDDLKANHPVDFQLLYHGYVSFEDDGKGGCVQKGERGSLLIVPVSPSDAQLTLSDQSIDGQSGGARDVTQGLATISSPENCSEARFVTLLHSFDTGSDPSASLQVEGDDLILNRAGEEYRVDLLNRDGSEC